MAELRTLLCRTRALACMPACVLVLLGACSGPAPQPEFEATDIEITAPLPGADVSAAYMRLVNRGDQDVRITRVESPQFERAAIHESRLVGDVVSMRPVADLQVPAQGELRLERGGRHIMLLDPVGEPLSATLYLYDNDAPVLTIIAPIGNER